MAELADAHGSGPCESNFMQVKLLLPATILNALIRNSRYFCFLERRRLVQAFKLKISNPSLSSKAEFLGFIGFSRYRDN